MIDHILKLIETNPMVGGGIAVVFSGLISYWLRAIPMNLYRLLKRELTTELSITDTNVAYNHLMTWISNNVATNKNKNIRYYKAYSITEDSKFIHHLSLGYGTHFIRYNGKMLFVTMTKDERKVMNDNAGDGDIINVKMFGRNKEPFVNLLKDIVPPPRSIKVIQTYAYLGNRGWRWIANITNRSASTVIINNKIKERIFNRITEFIKPETEQWYVKHGIIYKLGIMLTGEPGTGKSSLIHAIASEFNWDLCYVAVENLTGMTDRSEFGSDGSGKIKSIYVIEDIDTSKVVKNREDENDGMNITVGSRSDSLSNVLSILDGMGSHGSIIIMTTNHPDKIDPAIMRPGRCDLLEHIGYFGRDEIKEFMLNFFPNNKELFVPFDIKSKITGAYLQECVLRGMTAEEILTDIESNEPIKLKLSTTYGMIGNKNRGVIYANNISDSIK